MNEQQVRDIVRQEIQSLFGVDKYTFGKHLALLDGRHIQFGRTTGTKIGTAATQKVAFYGSVPVIQAGAISSPSGGVTQDTEARQAIDSIRTAIKNFGITG